MDFFGKKCCKCKNILHADDDIVICPDCGAPYHRECYINEGKCVFKKEHKNGFEWKPDDFEETNEPLTKKCWNCGASNREESMFCYNCGSMLNNKAPDNSNPYPNGSIPNLNIMFDVMGGIPKDEDFGDNVNAADLAKFIKINPPYYLREFKKVKDKKFQRFNFAAFIFSGFWLIYRKQYFWGTIATIILFILNIFSTFVNYFYNADILAPLSQQYINSDMDYLSYIQTAVSNANSISPFRGFMMILPFILSFIWFIVKIIIGFLGNKMYYKHCKSKIISIKSSKLDEGKTLDAALSENGGIDMKALIFIVLYQLVNLIISFI